MTSRLTYVWCPSETYTDVQRKTPREVPEQAVSIDLSISASMCAQASEADELSVIYSLTVTKNISESDYSVNFK